MIAMVGWGPNVILFYDIFIIFHACFLFQKKTTKSDGEIQKWLKILLRENIPD